MLVCRWTCVLDNNSNYESMFLPQGANLTIVILLMGILFKVQTPGLAITYLLMALVFGGLSSYMKKP